MANVMKSTSSVHVIFTAMIGFVVTALCCYTFYQFRMGTMREKSLTDAMKVIKAATEIVASIAEKGLPAIRSRIEDLETRNRSVEQGQRKLIERLNSSSASTQQQTTTVQESPKLTEAEIIAARRAARGM